MCSEIGSPRVSYSLDLGQTGAIPVEFRSHRSITSISSNPSPEFEFGVCRSFEYELSSADELFENGTILPVPVHMRSLSSQETRAEELQPLPFLSPLYSSPVNGKTEKTAKQRSKYTSDPIQAQDLKQPHEKVQSRSFWGFKRSSSLSSHDGNKLNLLFPLPSLSRSRSVSSVGQNPTKRSQKQQQQQQQQQCNARMGKSSSLSAYACPFPQRSLRKSHSGGSYYGNHNGGGITVSPVLNVPSPCISKGTANFLGLGCFFLRGKDKKNRP